MRAEIAALKRASQPMISTLGNKLKVATKFVPSQTVTFGMWCDTGSRHEQESNNGTAHFLEHMLFKGTHRRSLKDIDEFFELNGAHFNAYTSRDMTAYFLKCLSPNFEESMDVLADVLQNSTFASSYIERERSTILSEMEEVNSNIHEILLDSLHLAAFPTSSLRLTILGPQINIAKHIDGDMIRKYIGDHYTGPRMTLMAVGEVDHDYVTELAERYFGGLSSKNSIEGREPAEFNPGLCSQKVEVANSHVALAHQIPPTPHRDNTYMRLWQLLIGNWSVENRTDAISPFGKIIQQSGKAYQCQPLNMTYQDTGFFGSHLIGMPGVTCQELHDLGVQAMHQTFDAIQDSDLELARKFVTHDLLLNPDGLTNIADELGREMVGLGKPRDVVETVEQIQACTRKDLQDVADKYFTKKHASSLIGLTD